MTLEEMGRMAFRAVRDEEAMKLNEKIASEVRLREDQEMTVTMSQGNEEFVATPDDTIMVSEDWISIEDSRHGDVYLLPVHDIHYIIINRKEDPDGT